jgi:hypothetical protein
MHVVIWILAACCLPIAAAGIASLVDRRAGWSRVPFDPEETQTWTDAVPPAGPPYGSDRRQGG